MRGIRNPLSICLASLAAVLLGACGGGGGGGSGDATGTLSVGITDAAPHEVDQVWVRFTAVTVKPKNGGQQRYEINPGGTPPGKSVNLMDLTSGSYEQLLEDQVLPVGEYEWVALEIAENAPNEANNLYVVTEAGTFEPVEIPSGSQSGLRLVSGFTILANQSTEFIIDWDLNKALTFPRNGDGVWKLRPALRITDMAEYGRIEGTVSDLLFSGSQEVIDSCAYDANEDEGNAVYAFRVPAGVEFADVDVDDIDEEDRDGENPYATALVKWDGTNYSYSFEYMGVGDYKLAFTCEAVLDASDENNNIDNAPAVDPPITLDGDNPVDFTVLSVPVSVTNTEMNGQTTTAPAFE